MSADVASAFVAALERAGFDFFTGVPCSLFGGTWALLERMPAGRYVPAVREDSALAIAAGAWLGGRTPCVLMQNSGLGVSMNALASLHLIYDLPVLIVATWRGEGGEAGARGFADAPEHWIMGKITPGYFDLLRVPFEVLDEERIEAQVRHARATIDRTRRPAALIVKKGTFDAGH